MKDVRFYIRLFKNIIFALCKKGLSSDRTASKYTKNCTLNLTGP